MPDSCSHADVCRQANYTVQYNGANLQVSWSLHHVLHVFAAHPDCFLCFLEHERCHGSAAQVADRSGCECEIHRRASLRVHPRMHRVRSAWHTSLPWLAGWPPGEIYFLLSLSSTTQLPHSSDWASSYLRCSFPWYCSKKIGCQSRDFPSALVKVHFYHFCIITRCKTSSRQWATAATTSWWRRSFPANSLTTASWQGKVSTTLPSCLFSTLISHFCTS